MHLSKFSYYSDFVVYPIVIAALGAAGISAQSWPTRSEWFAAAVTGFVLWTLLEYVLHRVALHRIACFMPLHDAHHASPLSLVGTPTWMSVAVLSGAIFLPAWRCFGAHVATGLTAGVMTGYWWYGIVHHTIHHGAHKPPHSYFGGLRAWHLRHHYSPKSGNFGVTTAFWDHVFGTAIRIQGKLADSR